MKKINDSDNSFVVDSGDDQNHLSYYLKNKYLSFYINKNIYSIELLNIVEIISIQSITYIPCLPNYIKGAINLRGRVVPIIDMGIRLEDKELQYTDRTCIIVIDIKNTQIGLIVDYVHEVVYISKEQITSIPEHGNINANNFIDYIIKLSDSVLLNIDCEKLIDYSENI